MQVAPGFFLHNSSPPIENAGSPKSAREPLSGRSASGWKHTGVNRVAKPLNGWQWQIGKGRERYRAHGKTFLPSILPPLSFQPIWHTACHTVTGGCQKALRFMPVTLDGSTAF
jgi:hypothetical protein